MNRIIHILVLIAIAVSLEAKTEVFRCPDPSGGQLTVSFDEKIYDEEIATSESNVLFYRTGKTFLGYLNAATIWYQGNGSDADVQARAKRNNATLDFASGVGYKHEVKKASNGSELFSSSATFSVNGRIYTLVCMTGSKSMAKKNSKKILSWAVDIKRLNE